jgi:MFS family permease
MTLAALRSRDFRLYWIALIISAVGTWMQIVAQSLLVLRLSHGNAAPLGIVALAQAAAFFLFAPLGGSFADRVDRRRLLLLTNTTLMLVAFLTGLLVDMQVIRIWMIILAAFVSGVALSFDQPARYSLLPALVADADLPSAISLQSTVFAAAAALAPVLAGLSIARFGLAPNFLWNSGSYAVVICAIAVLHYRSNAARLTGSRARLWQSMREGVEIIWKDPKLVWTVSGYAILLFAAPSMPILLPVLVQQVVHSGAASLGLLFAVFGLGSIGGALLVPWLTGFVSRDRIFLASFALWVLAMATMGWTRYITVYPAALILLGASQSVIGVLAITLLQSSVAKGMRGRVMSIQTVLNMGIRPLGDYPISLLIAGVGAPATAGFSAIVIGACGLYLLSTRRHCHEDPDFVRQANQ